jgi:NAD(P)-dependent dehydrogenase (short-subunit alcohol dehydrogenase family)
MLDGRVAIVTGAGQGIGKGIALGLAAFGADVVCAERNPETLAETVAEIEAKGRRALASLTDVREGEAVEAMVKATVEKFGRIDILVNNVGGTFRTPFLEVNERGWEAVLRANLKSTFHCCRAVAPVMIEGGRGGSIINITTIEALRAGPGFAVYSAAKGGIAIFTKSLALELSEHKIRVNCIAPDVILTPGVQGLGNQDPAAERYHIPLRRAGTPEDVAGPAVFLASDLSSYVTGETIYVTGGTSAAGGWMDYPGLGWVTAPPAPGAS